jgi:hypothetical protein
VEMVDRASGRVPEGLLLTWLFMWWVVLGSVEDRPPGGIQGLVVRLGERRTSDQVGAVPLAITGLGVVPPRIRANKTFGKQTEEVGGWTWGCSVVGVTWWGH